MFDYREFLSTLTSRPGVYCMRDSADNTLYVGKAKNLKYRVSSYFRETEDLKLHQLVSQIARIDITVTPSEAEALLLENSLIKALKPKYNVLFRDDKSYPYLFLSDHLYPRLVYFRGRQKIPGRYYGPYPSAKAVKDTLSILQKLFKIRQCDDTFFKLRSRPCLQYQIKRCSAPCVKYISPEDYALDVENVVLFLQGKEVAVIESLVHKMQLASTDHNFELAAKFRDQISSLKSIFAQQSVVKTKGNVDVIVVAEKKFHFCVHLLYIRQGQVIDSQTFFPKQTGQSAVEEILRSFIIQFYLDKENKIDYPREIVINQDIDDQALIAQSISENIGKQVKITVPSRGQNASWLKLAHENAVIALDRKVIHVSILQKRFNELKKVLGIQNGLNCIECFDVSHLQGESTTASCVVFSQNGPQKSEYRRYNLAVKPGDDYEAIEQVLTKRYLKRKEKELPLPDIIMVDGGKGQLHRAKKALLECQLVDFMLIAIAKGEGRKPGLETLFIAKSQTEEENVVKLPPTSPALHLLQQIRDEAHRFAITSQRQKSQKKRKRSPLESIVGVGPKRRQQLLNYFGGQQGLMGASQQAISQVPGIGELLAAQIYLALHGD